MTIMRAAGNNMDYLGTCERMNSITDYKAILKSRQGPPNASR